MEKADPKVIAKSDEQAEYRCGHTGPASFAHEIFAREHLIKDEFVEKREKCGECLLDDVRPHLEKATCCAVCRDLILEGQDCLIFEGKVTCLSASCSPGPVSRTPGVWKDGQFVDGFMAGTIKKVSLGPSKD